MPDQAMYLFNNQYHPEVIDKVYDTIRAKTWLHNVHDQGALVQQNLYGGLITDFKCNEALNETHGFPAGAYTCFIPERLVRGNQKYILDHFVKNRETFSLREMLKNPKFEEQYIFHVSDYTYMNVRCQVTQSGTWLIIPIDTPDGVTSELMESWQSGDYSGPYSDERWFLERRPKVSYAYREGFIFNLVKSGNRIYLDQFTELASYYKTDDINDWKVCISDRTDNPSLMRTSFAVMRQDETGRSYLELSDTFVEYVKYTTFPIHCFLYHEGQKAGQTITPNYMGPTGYLFTKFTEYITSVDGRRFKVLITNPNDGGWVESPGVDKKFPDDDTIILGYTPTESWIAIPTKNGVPPINVRNFRVWEYDKERDTVGRMVSFEMSVRYPNMYIYHMKTDTEFLMVEWFRDDSTLDIKYNDITAGYRAYVGSLFYSHVLDGSLPNTIKNFHPYQCKMAASDFVKNLLLESYHDYRVQEITALLKETGMYYDVLYNALDEKNRRYKTYVYRMADDPELYATLKATGKLTFSSTRDEILPYDLYIDGVHVDDTKTRTDWDEFEQYILFPKELLTGTSVIIVDVYEHVWQTTANVKVENGMAHSLLSPKYPFKEISGSDIVISDTEFNRVPLAKIRYGVYAREMLIEVPFGLIDWDEFGITPDDPRIQSRIGTSEDGSYKALTFKVVVPMDVSYINLLTVDYEKIRDSQNHKIKVKAGDIYLFDPEYFSTGDGEDIANKFTKRINAQDLILSVDVPNITDIVVYNSNVRRCSITEDLSTKPYVDIIGFCGADDPSRLLPFVNGIMVDPTTVTGTIPLKVGGDFHITFDSTYASGSVGTLVYLPFPTEKHVFTSDSSGWTNLAGTGVMCICDNDMIFVDGKRVPTSDFKKLTNQMVKTPKANATYTLIRLCRDSNLYGFEDINAQSFMDKLFAESPGYKTYEMQKF